MLLDRDIFKYAVHLMLQVPVSKDMPVNTNSEEKRTMFLPSVGFYVH